MFSVFWVCLIMVHISRISTQSGPDPWDYHTKPPEISEDDKIPPDIRMLPKRTAQTENKLGIGEWFFKRTLVIFLKGGQKLQNEDGSVDISLQMKFESNEWEVVENCLNSETPLSEEMLRRILGLVHESIYKPSFVEKVAMAWTDYIQVYLTEYKTYITWTLALLATTGGLFWLWTRMSHKHALIILFLIFYAYEVIISYKEAEQNELNKFLEAVNRCKWYFWTSTCDVPPQDYLVFLKYMNPYKIAIRMFMTALAEPLVTISGTVDVMLDKLTAGLWYPFNKLTYGIFCVFIYISLIFLFVMIFFNWLLNIPCNFNFIFGLFGISVGQRNRTMFSNSTNQELRSAQEVERLSEATVNRILDVCSLALTNTQSNRDNVAMLQHRDIAPILQAKRDNVPTLQSTPGIRRSASTGRLQNLNWSPDNNLVPLENMARRRNIPLHGGGDAG